MKILLLLAALSTQAFGAVNDMSFLYGKWVGTGTKSGIVRDTSECNYSRMNGQLGIIEAKYVEVESKKIDREFGILSPLDNKGNYKFIMYKPDGSIMEAKKASVDGNKKTGYLEFEINGTTARYFVTVTGNDWLEVGEIYLKKEDKWKEFYRMTMTKVSDTCR